MEFQPLKKEVKNKEEVKNEEEVENEGKESDPQNDGTHEIINIDNPVLYSSQATSKRKSQDKKANVELKVSSSSRLLSPFLIKPLAHFIVSDLEQALVAYGVMHELACKMFHPIYQHLHDVGEFLVTPTYLPFNGDKIENETLKSEGNKLIEIIEEILQGNENDQGGSGSNNNQGGGSGSNNEQGGNSGSNNENEHGRGSGSNNEQRGNSGSNNENDQGDSGSNNEQGGISGLNNDNGGLGSNNEKEDDETSNDDSSAKNYQDLYRFEGGESITKNKRYRMAFEAICDELGVSPLRSFYPAGLDPDIFFALWSFQR